MQLLPSPLKETVAVWWLVEFSCATVTKSFEGGYSRLVGGVLLCNCYQVL